jgi:hypothetical protein
MMLWMIVMSIVLFCKPSELVSNNVQILVLLHVWIGTETRKVP